MSIFLGATAVVSKQGGGGHRMKKKKKANFVKAAMMNIMANHHEELVVLAPQRRIEPTIVHEVHPRVVVVESRDFMRKVQILTGSPETRNKLECHDDDDDVSASRGRPELSEASGIPDMFRHTKAGNFVETGIEPAIGDPNRCGSSPECNCLERGHDYSQACWDANAETETETETTSSGSRSSSRSSSMNGRGTMNPDVFFSHHTCFEANGDRHLSCSPLISSDSSDDDDQIYEHDHYLSTHSNLTPPNHHHHPSSGISSSNSSNSSHCLHFQDNSSSSVVVAGIDDGDQLLFSSHDDMDIQLWLSSYD